MNRSINEHLLLWYGFLTYQYWCMPDVFNLRVEGTVRLSPRPLLPIYLGKQLSVCCLFICCVLSVLTIECVDCLFFYC